MPPRRQRSRRRRLLPLPRYNLHGLFRFRTVNGDHPEFSKSVSCAQGKKAAAAKKKKKVSSSEEEEEDLSEMSDDDDGDFVSAPRPAKAAAKPRAAPPAPDRLFYSDGSCMAVP